jgi:hypothetical protein
MPGSGGPGCEGRGWKSDAPKPCGEILHYPSHRELEMQNSTSKLIMRKKEDIYQVPMMCQVLGTQQ